MSMSSLGAQLAAISAPGRNAGSTLATSKRHEDAVGRGLAHSVQVGHAMNNKSHLYKASILHQDARTASDVPLATIRENCVASLQHLESIDADFGSFVDTLCKASIQERGLMMATENDKVDKHIEDLLYRLSLVMGSGSSKKTNDNLLSCLNVIEFLLRKYEIHIRPKSACTMLLTMLPHHEEPFFLRILQLVDLASLPEWAFLRPYAIPGAKLGRSILAQNASKDIAMIRNLGRLSQRNSKLPGASKSLSFTAAVLVEALTLQTQRKGSMEERTCQVLLPFVVNACKNEQYYKKAKSGKQFFDGSLWQNWGYILASTLVENAVLAPEPRSLLVTSVLQGLALQQEATIKSKDNRKNDSHLSSGLMVSLTILAQNPAENGFSTEENEKDNSSYLPLLSSSCAVSAKQCGFPSLDKDVFSALLKLEDYDNESGKDTKNIKSSKSNIAACIANLYHQDGMVDFQQWVASILVFGWKRFIKYRKQNHDQTDKRSRKAKINSTKILNLILNLAKHSHLEQLWKRNDGQWIESFISFVFQNTPISVLDALEEEANEDEESRFSEEEYVRAILQALRSIDGVAYDRGVTHALIRIKNADDRMGLAKYLGLAKTKSMGSDDAGEPSEEGEPDEPTINLPPRVGLEHADSRIRLEAINSLLEEAKDQDKMEIDDDGEDTARALFRRFLMDDNREVALAAAKALDEILVLNNKEIETAVGIAELSEGALEALYRWARSPSDEEKLNEQLLAHCCRLAASAVEALRASNQTDLSFIQLVEGLGSFLLHSNTAVSLAAAAGILSAFDKKAKKSNKAGVIQNQAKALLISEGTILQGFQRSFRQRNSSELHIRRQLSRVILDAISTVSSKTDVSKEALGYNIWLTETFGSSLTQDESKALAESFIVLSSRLTADLETLHSTFCRLASNEDSLFDGVAAPYIHAACENMKDKQGGDISAVAVVMEVALSSDSFNQIKNLLSVANEMASKDIVGNFYAIAPALALCCHQDEKIRRLSIAFLSQLSKRISKASSNHDWMILNILCQYFSEKKSSVVLKGASFISESLASLLSSSDKALSIREYLLQAVLCSVTGYAGKSSISASDFFASSWLDSRNVTGGYKTASTLLDVTESAGEAAFPILSRWEDVGQPLLSHFLSNLDDDVSYQQSQFIHATVKILRGTTVSTPSALGTSTIISTGPSSHGRRARSYSFGKSDGVGVLSPYPTSMQESIISILTSKTESPLNNELRICLFELVLSSSSWRTKMFSQLNGKVRQKIASAMLVAATESLYQGVDSVLMSLPLDANDISKLMRDQENDEVGLSKLTFISDFINMNHSKLSTSSGIHELFPTIFKTLAKFAEATKTDDSIEFARHALLSALLELIKSSLGLGSMSSDLGTKKKTFDSWLNTLLLTVSNSADISVPLRSKRTIFFIFASLCNKYPKTVTPKLMPLMNGLVSHSLSPGEENTLADCFDLIVPVFFKQASASNLSPVDLFQSFINCVCKYDEEVRPKFYMAFVHALSMIPKKGDFEASAVGSFVAAVLARERYCPSDTVPAKNLFSKLPELATKIFSSTSRETRIKAVWTMQNYAKEILFHILGEETSSTPDAFFPSQNLVDIATKGPDSIGNKASKQSLSEASSSVVVESLCSLLISVTCEVVTSYDLRNIIKCTDGTGSALVLRLWQDLLLIQSACHNRLGGSNNHAKSELLERIVEITAQALECIQSSLPSHIFLAFVTSLVTEGETQELRARAVQLIAERSASTYMGKSEAALFVEMIPALLKLLDDGTGDFLHQSVFAAVDSIGRNACISGESPANDRHLGIFSNATFKAANILQREMLSSSQNFLDIPTESRQLVSSAALCSSTAIKICGPRALPVLPKLIKPLLSFLVAASSFIESSTEEEDDIDKRELSQAKLMQLAIMRTFRSIVERMPMLLQPYLVGILTTFGKVSGSFLSDSLNQTQSIQTEMVSLQKIMTSNIPTRQLIPAASKSIFSTPNVELNLSNLSIMIESITNSKSSEVSGMISLVIKTATYVFDQDSIKEGSSAVMQAADELLLCLVMKLSEVQLRSLYRKLREWRGDLDRSDPEQTAARRSAFWRFSSTLSKNLKSIYLSCLSTVFSDAVDELEMAVSCLPEKEGVKKANGKKRQRVTNSEESNKFQSSSLQALKNLLLCLEASLRSDAHEDGDWIREMESQRYDKMMEPLGKLMHCRLPENDSNMTFESLVQGDESQSGSVVECLVALASAAGDEQLWKPLNHAVLQACSDEDRVEVRKAGATCLLSLINSIGEEYMVLIPECLPVLSELLEDPDEDVSGTAQECISQSEELLGESLQDSLR